MGIMIMYIVIFALIILVVGAVIYFIVGLKIKKKHRKVSKVLFGLAAFNIVITGSFLLWAFLPRPETFKTKDGEVTLKHRWIVEYREYLYAEDTEGLKKMLDKHPEMIHYRDVNGVSLLEMGMYNMNTELMQLAIDHGEIFDDPIYFEHRTYENSFDALFSKMDYPSWEKEEVHKAGVVTDDILETVEFMIEHGASMTYEKNRQYKNFYEEAADWIKLDNSYSKKDKDLLALIEKYIGPQEE